jgi:hypothetical protein
MARTQRIEYEGAVYHVTARGNERREIFRDDADREHFLRVLGESVGRFDVRLYLFCLIGLFQCLTPDPTGTDAGPDRGGSGADSGADAHGPGAGQRQLREQVGDRPRPADTPPARGPAQEGERRTGDKETKMGYCPRFTGFTEAVRPTCSSYSRLRTAVFAKQGAILHRMEQS